MANALTRNTAAVKQAKTNTPPKSRVPGRNDQVVNNEGGYVFQVSDKDRLERFLILGTDGGTFYAGEKKLTEQNIDFIRKMIKSNEKLVVDTAVDVSVNGRAHKNGPAIFAIALVLSEGQDKEAARAAVQKVARISTHIFELAQYLDDLGGWGRAKRKAVAEWYETKTPDELAYQAVKYRQRNGWTHRDLMRLSHPKGVDKAVGDFILGKSQIGASELTGVDRHVQIISGFKALQEAQTVSEVLFLLRETKLPWEAVPTQYLKDPKVWKTLFYNGQLNGQALVRNITRLAKIGAFKDMQFAADYAAKLTDVEMIRKTRLHPINLLNALVVYQEGRIVRDNNAYGWYSAGRQKDWETDGVIVDALNEAFHLSFKTIKPAGKRTLIGLDVSGSMGSAASGLDLSCAQVGAAVAMTVARTEPAHKVMGFSNVFKDLEVSSRMGFTEVLRRTSNLTFGGTDCSLPMVWALKNDVEVDTFVVITDNETYQGQAHPFQALKTYRNKTGIDARLAVLGVAATPFTIADPEDSGMMDFVGFDSSGPAVLAEFSAGRL